MNPNTLMIQFMVFFSIFSQTEKNDKLNSIPFNNKIIPDNIIDKDIKPNGFKRKIGILSYPMSKKMINILKQKNNGRYSLKLLEKMTSETSQINQIYFDFIKNRLMEPVPVEFYSGIEVIKKQMEQLDGILLPGGPTYFDLREFENNNLSYFRVVDPEDQFLVYIKEIIQKAKEINEEGRTFVVFGICLGFQGIILAESNMDIRISNVRRKNHNDYLYINKGSQVDNQISSKYVKTLKNKKLTFFNHDLGFKVSDFNKFEDLKYQYHISSTFKDSRYGRCVAALEHKFYPIYGIQFHPEKIIYDDSGHYDLNKGKIAKRISKQFENLFSAAFEFKKRSEKQKISYTKEIYEVLVPDIGIYGTVSFISRNPEVKLLLNIS